MMTKVMTYAIAGLLLSLSVLGFLYRAEVRAHGALQERERLLETAIEAQRGAIQRAAERERSTGKLLAARERERNELRAKASALESDLLAMKRGDENVKTWMETAVPDAVLRRLRQGVADATPGNRHPAPGAIDPGSPGAGPAR